MEKIRIKIKLLAWTETKLQDKMIKNTNRQTQRP